MEETCRDWRCFKQRIPVQGGFVLITGLSPRLFPSCIQHVRHRHSPGAPRTWGALPFPIRQSSAHPFRSSPGRWGPRSSPPTAVLGDGGRSPEPKAPLGHQQTETRAPGCRVGGSCQPRAVPRAHWAVEGPQVARPGCASRVCGGARARGI